MTEFPRPSFIHRRNPDGTVDSICLRCFLTTDHAKEESALDKVEDAHVCTPNEPSSVLLIPKKR
jgi:hypothetical protein